MAKDLKGMRTITATLVREDFRRLYNRKKKWLKVAAEDINFNLGNQWQSTDIQTMKQGNVRALTINKIRPAVNLLTGMESQNRSDFLAYPEGKEDSINSDIATGLLKNVMKVSNGDYKVSEQFETCLQPGEAFVEPYYDHSYNVINGELKFKLLDYNQLFYAKHKEYDGSDASHVCKITYGISEMDLRMMFPEKDKEITEIGGNGRLAIAGMPEIDESGIEIQTKGYNKEDDIDTDNGNTIEKTYDLIEYSYKKPIKHYYILDRKLKRMKEVDTKEMADTYVAAAGPLEAATIVKVIPEIWVASVVGDKMLENEISPFYPKWRTYHYFPLYAYRSTQPIQDKEYLIQGLVRALKDPQREHNKRRTQELKHLNQSSNSGYIGKDGAYKDKSKWETSASQPGVILEYNQGFDRPEKITPTPLSQGHSQMAAEHAQDMKEISGINTDLLAQNESQASGRAIRLRQKQGIMMVQNLFDNLSQTKRMWGRFVLSQLGEVFDIDSAVRVMGDAFIKETFSVPITVEDPNTGEVVPRLDPETGKMMTEVDVKAVATAFNTVLEDTAFGVYDVSVGEGSNNETTRYANYITLIEMARERIPIPPDLIIEESLLNSVSKEKIARAIEAQAARDEKATQEKAQGHRPKPKSAEAEKVGEV